MEKAEEIVADNYRNNPDYLFAKLNYAQICIRNGELNKIPGIFDRKFELKLLYPQRNEFHISEVVGFMGVMGQYFCLCGNLEQAMLYYDNLKELVPSHPFTKKLHKMLLSRSFKNIMAKWIEK